MDCSNCGQDKVSIRYITQAFGEGDQTVIIEDIPVESCSNCGEGFLAYDTARRLDKLIKGLRSNLALRTNERALRVASFKEEPMLEQPSEMEKQVILSSLSPSAQHQPYRCKRRIGGEGVEAFAGRAAVTQPDGVFAVEAGAAR